MYVLCMYVHKMLLIIDGSQPNASYEHLIRPRHEYVASCI